MRDHHEFLQKKLKQIQKTRHGGAATLPFAGFFYLEKGMALKTTLEQLESVQTAIAAIEGGSQSYQLGDKRLTRADLGMLYAREDRLLSRYRLEKGAGGPVIVTGIPRRDY